MNVFCRREWSLLDDNTTCSSTSKNRGIVAVLHIFQTIYRLSLSNFQSTALGRAFIQHDESNYDDETFLEEEVSLKNLSVSNSANVDKFLATLYLSKITTI